MVSTRSQYLIHILDKIGSPLLASINNVQQNADESATAQTMASLLAKTVELSIAIGDKANLHDGTEDDSLRVALATLAGPVIAERYTQDKNAPDESTIKKMIAGLESALTFSENFNPSIKTSETVKAAEDNAPNIGAAHNLHYLNSVLPIINAVTTANFGRPEAELITAIGTRLSKHADTLRDNLFSGDIDENGKKAASLVCLRAIATLYAECHTQAAQNAGTIDTVWENFDKQSALLETLVKSIVDPGSISTPANGPTAQQPSAPPTATTETAPTAPPPTQPAAPTTPPPAAETPPAAPSGGGPMGFFAKKDSSAPADPPPAPPPVPETPPAAAETTPPSAPTPTAPPPAEQEKADDSSASSGESGGGGNPMSFFKTPPKDE